MTDNWRQKLTAFLKEYMNIPADRFPATGVLPDAFISLGLYSLIHEQVFDSVQDLQHQAYEEYGILIPESMLEVNGND